MKASEKLSLAGTRFEEKKITLGAWEVSSYQYVDKDWNYYSKSWHRAHGPKVTISGRKIIFTRPWGRGKQVKAVLVNSWAGDFVARAVVELDLAPKKSEYSLKIRLNKAYDANLVATKRGYKIYQRTLLGEAQDWVIESPLGMIYHADQREGLIKGLHQKIRAQARKLNGTVDWALCKKLGFCDAGIKAFCATFGFNPRGKYMPQDIESAVRENPRDASPFFAELKTLAKALNYQITL